jgi:pimeloyl-ACP methyl ester carboxylesterase
LIKLLLRSIAVLAVLVCAVGAAFYWNPLWFYDQQIRYHLWRANVRSEYVTVDGSRIHYFEAIPSDGSAGKPLLLIHGLGSRGEDWSPLIPSLAAAGFHVYAPDLLGFGRSAKPAQCCSIHTEEQLVSHFILATNLAIDPLTHQPAPIDIAGWSMGGWVAAKLAIDEPAWIDRLILYDSAGLDYHPTFPRNAFVPTDTAGIERLVALITTKPQPMPPFVARASLRKIARNGSIVQHTLDEMESGRDLLDTQLAEIRQPTLIVWGADDKLIPISVGQTMHRGIPGSSFDSVPGCGHLAPADCAQPVLAATIQLLKSTKPSNH